MRTVEHQHFPKLQALAGVCVWVSVSVCVREYAFVYACVYVLSSITVEPCYN